MITPFEELGVPVYGSNPYPINNLRTIAREDYTAIIEQAQREVLRDVKPLLTMRGLDRCDCVDCRRKRTKFFLAKYAALLSDSEREGK